MNTRAKNGSAWAFAAIAIAACVYAFYTHAIWTLYTNPDAGWLIQTGQHILNHGAFEGDQFSWTNTNRPIVVYQWLFAILLAALFRFGSLWFVGLTACLVVASLIFWFLPRIWINKGLPVFLPFACLALVQTPNWFQARPQLISYMLTLAFVSVLERYRTSSNARWLAILPPLMLLWVNVHLLYTLGLGLILVYLLCRLWRQRAVPVALSACLFVGCLCVFINPYGASLLPYLSTFFTDNQLAYNREYQPCYSSVDGWLAFAGVMAAWVPLVMARRKLNAEALILSALVTLAALFARRFQPLAILTMWGFVADALLALGWFKPQQTSDTGLKLRVAQAALALCVPIISWCCQVPDLTAAWMVYTEDSLPLLAAYQKAANPNDHLFNDPTIGSWLIGLQSASVFIDTRFDFYPKRFVQASNECVNAEGDWAKWLDRWGITQILLRDQTPLNQALMYSPEWTLALHDGWFAWWTRKTELTDAIFKHWSISDDLVSDSKLPAWIIKNTIETRAAKHLLLSRIYREQHKTGAAIEEAEMGLKLLPQSSALQKELALCGQSM